MAAGQGFKTFTTGEVLTAADVNGYLMQGVGVFTDAANRDAEITSPQEGQFAYLKDTNVTTYYTGSAWANLDTTGMTNPMTTTGDTIYSSSGSTPARLGIGSTGQVLTVSGGLPVWATAASGGMTLLSTTTLSGSSTTISSISQNYKNLLVIMKNATNSNNATPRFKLNGSGTYVTFINGNGISSPTNGGFADVGTNFPIAVFNVYDYANTNSYKTATFSSYQTALSIIGVTTAIDNSAITSIVFEIGAGTWSGGTVLIYGVS